MARWHQMGARITDDGVVYVLSVSNEKDVAFIGNAGDVLKQHVRLYSQGTRLEIRTDGPCFDFALSEAKSILSRATRTKDDNIRDIPMGTTEIKTATGTISFKTHDFLSTLLYFLIIDKAEFNKTFDLVNLVFTRSMK